MPNYKVTVEFPTDIVSVKDAYDSAQNNSISLTVTVPAATRTDARIFVAKAFTSMFDAAIKREIHLKSLTNKKRAGTPATVSPAPAPVATGAAVDVPIAVEPSIIIRQQRRSEHGNTAFTIPTALQFDDLIAQRPLPSVEVAVSIPDTITTVVHDTENYVEDPEDSSEEEEMNEEDEEMADEEDDYSDLEDGEE